MNEVTAVIIENAVQVTATLLLMLIGVLGTWISTKIAKREELKNISAATAEATKAAQTTVLELQQTTVEYLKADSADGKLTKDEIDSLGKALLEGTIAKMSASAVKLLNAAGVDLSELIKGVGESMIAGMK